MQTVIFLTGVAGDGATTLKYANAHGPRFLTGYHATNKLTAATLLGNTIAGSVSTAHRRAQPGTVF